MSPASQNECYIAILYTVPTQEVWCLHLEFQSFAAQHLWNFMTRLWWERSQLHPIAWFLIRSGISGPSLKVNKLSILSNWNLLYLHFFTRLGSCFVFFVKHFSNITGRFSLVTAWRRTPQAVAPSAALRFAPPVPQLQLAKQRCWGRQQGYQNPDQIKSKSGKKSCVDRR